MRASPPSPAAATRPARAAAASLLLFALTFAIYAANFRLRGTGDSLPTRVLPFSLLREGDLDLDEFSWDRTRRNRLPYYLHVRDGHIYSVSPIATSIVVTPFYIPAAWWMAARGISYDDVRARVVIVVMERLAAAALTALSASLLFGVLRRLTQWHWAVLLTLIYALGTSTWALSSQALWPHALAELMLVLLSRFLIEPRPSTGVLALAGLSAALAVANRPQMIIFAGLAGVYAWVRWRWRALAFAIPPLLLGGALAGYNRAIFQTVAGGYGGFDHFGGPLFEGMAGLFISPNRGLLVFTPIMAFALWGAVRVWWVPAPAWLRWLSVGVAMHVIVHAKFDEWWAGYTYGPRYMTDVLPALTIFLVYGLVPLCRRPAMRAFAAVLALYGVAVQAIGAYAADESWNREPVPLERAPSRVWDWSDLQIVRSARNGFRGLELAHVMVDAFRDPLPARVAPLQPEDLAAAIQASGVPSAMAVGSRVPISVSIENRAAIPWPAFNGESMIGSRRLVFLMVRWLGRGEPVAGVGDVILLPENVAPGERIDMLVTLEAPRHSGDYELELRVTQAVDGTRGVIGPGSRRFPLRVR
ncbi:MAG: hypothetical protein AB7V27_10975 [Candidatus Binatia bacterium]